MSEKPLERLNYFNGQRLEAADLKTEQEYHVRTRRWLNKSLYTAGIARGLEVRAIKEGPKKDTPYVSVSPGLALDNDGREIILLEDTPQEVISFAGTDATKVEGNYLVIEYGEEIYGHSQGTCSSGNRAPSFITGKPKFFWVPYIPQPGSNQIVLAQVELKKGCKEIEAISLNQRQIVRNASTASVRQYALEGEREVAFIPKNSFPLPKPPANDDRIDVNAKGRIYFHIRGGAQSQSPSVILYLKAEEFSPLHYTELGKHSHSSSATGFSVTIPQHFHSIPAVPGQPIGNTGLAGKHKPSYSDIRGSSSNIVLNKIHGFTWTLWDPPVNVDQSLQKWANMRITFKQVPDHRHVISDKTEYEPERNIPLTGKGDTGIAGVSNVQSRSESPAKSENAFSYVDNLQVYIWRVENPDDPSPQDNQTAAILQQLEDYYPEWRQLRQSTPNDMKLGNGGAGHVFATKGTGAIQLNFLSNKLVFSEGEYCIEFRVKEGRQAANGGKIHYNLYVE
jgi:hypothetical protein